MVIAIFMIAKKLHRQTYVWKSLQHQHEAILASYDKPNLTYILQFYEIYHYLLEPHPPPDKMLGKPCILSLFPNSSNRFFICEHLCKILYYQTCGQIVFSCTPDRDFCCFCPYEKILSHILGKVKNKQPHDNP